MLNADGLSGVTLRSIGARAGLSRQAPYSYFRNKVELLEALAVAGLGGMIERASLAVVATASAERKLADAVRGYVTAALEEPELYALVFSRTLEASVTLKGVGVAALEWLRTLLAPLVDEAEALETTAAVWAHLHGVVMLALSGHTDSAKGMSDPVESAVVGVRLLVRGSRAA